MQTAPRPRRGRPPKSEAAARQDQFLDYCLGRFMTAGYRNVSVDELALGFGLSKSTIYLHYGSKAGLVRAAAARAAPQLRKPLERVSTARGRKPREVLEGFATIISRYTNDPNTRALWQAISEARDELDDADDLVERETRAVLMPITRYLRQLADAGMASIPDEQQAANYFTELVGGGLNRFLGKSLPGAERKQAITNAVDFFCRGIGLREGAPE